MGSLYRRKQKQPDGTWRELPTIWIKFYQNGRAIRESTKTTKETVARRMLRTREGDVEHGIQIVPKMGRITFEDAAKDLVTEYLVNKRRSHPQTERRIALHLTPTFRGRLLANITTPDVRAFTAARQTAGASNAEINRELAALKRMFTLAMQAGKIAARPYIPMLREDNVRQGFFEREQFDAVTARLPGHLAAVVTFAYLTGWRIQSEVLKLQWRQVDLVGASVRLDAGTTKNREARTFPVTPELRTLLEAQQRERDALKERGTICPSVFHRNGLAIKSFRKTWAAACTGAGCPGRIPHDLRRSAVRNLVRAGVSERVAMQLTGHKTRSVFERYNIVSEGDLTDAATKLSAFTGTLSGTIGADQPGRPVRIGRK
jgi:integrase